MEMTLNVRGEGGSVEKTYTAETYDLMWGTMEDVLSAVDLDALVSDGGKGGAAAAAAGGKLLVKSMGQIKPLLKDVFPGITDDEIKRVPVKEIAACVMNIVACTVEEVLAFGGDGKN